MKGRAVNEQSAAGAALIVTMLSLLAPISGIVFEMTLAWRFGATGTVDALRVTLLILVFALQIFFNALLPNVAIPIISDLRASGREDQAWGFVFFCGVFLTFVCLIPVLLISQDPSTLVSFLGPGLEGDARSDALILSKAFVWVCLMMVWCGVFSALLNAYRIFWLTVIVRVIPNIFIIAAVAFMGRNFGVVELAAGYVVAYGVILTLFLGYVLALSKRCQVSLTGLFLFLPLKDLFKAAKDSLPISLMIIVTILTDIIVNRELSNMQEGVVSIFGYSWKLLALMSLIPSGLLMVVFPALSDAHSAGEKAEFERLLARLFKFTALLSLPAGAFVWVDATSIVQILFDRGEMDAQSLDLMVKYFQILLLGAPGASMYAALCKVSFARGDTFAPAITACASSSLALILVPLAAAHGSGALVALAVSGISWISFLMLFLIQIFRYSLTGAGELISYLGRVMVMACLLWLTFRVGSSYANVVQLDNAFLEIIMLALRAVIFISMGYVFCRVFDFREVNEGLIAVKTQFYKWLKA